MIKKFKYKLILCFVALIVVLMGPTTILINSTITRIGQNRILENIDIAKDIFNQVNLSRRQKYSDSLDVLINTHPQIRALMGSLDLDSNNDLFGQIGPNVNNTLLNEINEKLYSIVSFLPIYKEADIFAITDSSGRLLFTKAKVSSRGGSLADLDLISEALKGQAKTTWWRSNQKRLLEADLIQGMEQKALFDIFVKPIVFQGVGVKGLLITGFKIGAEHMKMLSELSRSQISFLANGESFGSSQKLMLQNGNFYRNKTISEGHFYFQDGEETYIGGELPLLGPTGKQVASAVIYRSMTHEMTHYTRLKRILNFVALAAVLLAVGLSILLSSRVTRVIGILIQAVKKVGSGDLEVHVQVDTNDEFKQLADAVNMMAHSLKDKEAVTRIFKKYVDTQVVDNILKKNGEVKLGGIKKNVIIFFSDIADFTSISENLPPEKVVDFLNEYLGAMSSVIEEHGGIIDKYIGDAILAYWEGPQGVEQVLRTSLEQRKALKTLKLKWGQMPGLMDFNFRIGIHRGEVIVGNIGSEKRMNHTIIGDSVNTASRLEKINKDYGTHIAVSEEVQSLAGPEFRFRELDFIAVKGRSESIRIYELLEQEENSVKKVSVA